MDFKCWNVEPSHKSKSYNQNSVRKQMWKTNFVLTSHSVNHNIRKNKVLMDNTYFSSVNSFLKLTRHLWRNCWMVFPLVIWRRTKGWKKLSNILICPVDRETADMADDHFEVYFSFLGWSSGNRPWKKTGSSWILKNVSWGHSWMGHVVSFFSRLVHANILATRKFKFCSCGVSCLRFVYVSRYEASLNTKKRN